MGGQYIVLWKKLGNSLASSSLQKKNNDAGRVHWTEPQQWTCLPACRVCLFSWWCNWFADVLSRVLYCGSPFDTPNSPITTWGIHIAERTTNATDNTGQHWAIDCRCRETATAAATIDWSTWLPEKLANSEHSVSDGYREIETSRRRCMFWWCV